MVTITTASGTEAEESVSRMLGELLKEYDVSRWQITDQVVIDEGAIAHSHPVLTLGTRFIIRTRLGVLSAYLHEQIHWYLWTRRDASFAAIAELRELYPVVPSASDGGARDEESTYLHLLVNWLELEALRAAVGADDADATVRQAVDGPVYGWVYRQVFDNHAAIAEVVARHGLDAVLTQ